MSLVKYTLLWCFNLIICCFSIPLFPPEYEIYQAVLVHEEHNNEGSDYRKINVPADIYDIVNHILEVELKDLFNNNNFPNEINNNLEPVDIGNRINTTLPEDNNNNNIPLNPPGGFNQTPEKPTDIPPLTPAKPEEEVTGKPPEDNNIPIDIFTSEKPSESTPDLPVNKPEEPIDKPTEAPITTTKLPVHIEEQPTEQPPPETTTLPDTTTETHNTVSETTPPETTPVSETQTNTPENKPETTPVSEEQTNSPENKPETTTVLPESGTEIPVTIPEMLEGTTEESTEEITQLPTTTETIPNVDIISREELSKFRDDSQQLQDRSSDKIAAGTSEQTRNYKDLIHVMEASDLIELIRLVTLDSTFLRSKS